MKDLPNPFWAALFMVFGLALAALALFHPNVQTVTMAVLTLASNIVSGSFGYINGHNAGQNSNPTPPVEPAQK